MLQQLSQWSKTYYGFLLIIILGLSFLARMWNLGYPAGYMFDEVYHGITSKLISRNDPRAYEWWNPPVEPNTAVDWLHPPLAKYTQAVSILVFGENSLGWRFSSTIFGVLVIFTVAQLAKTITNDERVGLLAALLTASDTLLLVQSRIAMNDIHVTFAILVTLLLYAVSHPKLHGTHTQTKLGQVSTERLLLVGALAGIAIATKWSGFFVLLVVALFELVGIGSGVEWKKPGYWLSWIGIRVLGLLFIPFFVYVASYSQMFLQGKDFEHFKELHKQIYWYQTNLKAEHPYQSRPWQWVTDLRPVWYHVEYLGDTRSDVFAIGNPVLFWAGAAAVLATCLKLLQQFIQNLTKKQVTAIWFFSVAQDIVLQPVSLVVASYFAVWLPWQFSPRIMFFYHYAPAVPLFCILLSWMMVKNQSLQKLSIALVLAILACFVIWYPHATGIPVSSAFKDAVYFATERWK